jgi:RNA polymerase sigma-70 factor (ECF subfamily)
MDVRDADKDASGYPSSSSIAPSTAVTPPTAVTPLTTVAPSAPDPVELLAAVYRDFPGLRALIMRRVRDPQVAADILQDAAVTTLEKLRAGEIAQPNSIGGFVYRVALNHLRNYRRKDRTGVSSSEELESLPDGNETPDMAGIDGAQWAAALRRMLEKLPTARDRELLIRFYLEDESKEAVCAALGLSDDHFNRVLFRARNRFRALLERHGYGKMDLLSLALVGLSLIVAFSGVALWVAEGKVSL